MAKERSSYFDSHLIKRREFNLFKCSVKNDLKKLTDTITECCESDNIVSPVNGLQIINSNNLLVGLGGTLSQDTSVVSTGYSFTINNTNSLFRFNDEGILAQVSNNNTIKFDTPGLAGASNGYIWTLIDQSTGAGEWVDIEPFIESLIGNASGDSDWIINGNNQYSGVSENVGIGIINPNFKLTTIGTFLNSYTEEPVHTSKIYNNKNGFTYIYDSGTVVSNSQYLGLSTLNENNTYLSYLNFINNGENIQLGLETPTKIQRIDIDESKLELYSGGDYDAALSITSSSPYPNIDLSTVYSPTVYTLLDVSADPFNPKIGMESKDGSNSSRLAVHPDTLRIDTLPGASGSFTAQSGENIVVYKGLIVGIT